MFVFLTIHLLRVCKPDLYLCVYRWSTYGMCIFYTYVCMYSTRLWVCTCVKVPMFVSVPVCMRRTCL